MQIKKEKESKKCKYGGVVGGGDCTWREQMSGGCLTVTGIKGLGL